MQGGTQGCIKSEPDVLRLRQPRRHAHGGHSLRRLDAAIRSLQKMNPPVRLAPTTPDVLVHNEGTVFLFCPLTPRAKQWIADNVQPDAMFFGNALVAEHRFVWALAQGMKDAGLELE